MTAPDSRKGFVCSIASSDAELRLLAIESAHLWAGHERPNPLPFFLSTLNSARWRPWVIGVRKDGVLIGLVYLKERVFGWFSSGLFSADCTLGTAVVSEPETKPDVFEAAIRKLMSSPGARSLRLFAAEDSYEISLCRKLMKELKLEVSERPVDSHVVLPLKQSFDEFASGLGPKTRRNFRYYRRKSAQSQIQFVERMGHDEFNKAAQELASQGVVGANRIENLAGARITGNAARPLLVGLKTPGGEWLSVLGGWYEADRVVVYMQFNSDKEHARESLSVVLRSYLIEMLIQQGQREVLWWGGVAPPISRYCQPFASRCLQVDRTTFSWTVLRRILHSQRHSYLGKRLPIKQWIQPPRPDSSGSGAPKAQAASAGK